MNSARISVITPSFNQGHFLGETILSVISQDYDNFEYIIIDGGSTDNSVEIIKKYEKHLAYWISEKDSGQSEAINKGFKRATGDIVCWINSDDILLPNALRNVAKFFAENGEIDLLNGHLLIIDKNSKIISNYYILRQKDWYARQGVFYVAQQSMFWKRGLLERFGYLNENFHALMDREFLIRIFRHQCKIGHMNKILAAIRKHEMTKTSFNGNIWSDDQAALIDSYPVSYGRKPKINFIVIYGLEKLVRGLYFKYWLFKFRWKGKHVSSLTIK